MWQHLFIAISLPSNPKTFVTLKGGVWHHLICNSKLPKETLKPQNFFHFWVCHVAPFNSSAKIAQKNP
jgi:hypothetical protein